jgi:hypothetical protein
VSWRSGSKLFCETWPLTRANIPDREHRIDFTTRRTRRRTGRLLKAAAGELRVRPIGSLADE